MLIKKKRKTNKWSPGQQACYEPQAHPQTWPRSSPQDQKRGAARMFINIKSSCVTGCHCLSQLVTGCHSLQMVFRGCHKLSQPVGVYQRLSQIVTACKGLWEVVTNCHSLSEFVRGCHKLSQLEAGYLEGSRVAIVVLVLSAEARWPCVVGGPCKEGWGGRWCKDQFFFSWHRTHKSIFIQWHKDQWLQR